MKIAVLGTGSAGRAIAARLQEVGHEVTVGTRDPKSTLARREGDSPYFEWAAWHEPIALATFSEATEKAEVVFNASNGALSLEVLNAAGTENLAGKVLVDLANPLDFSNGFPPSLFVKDTDSLGEQIQRAFPEALVVKTLNTMNASLMVHPEALPDPGSVFVSGNDAEAKLIVSGLLHEFGHTDVIDLGDITTARGVEMLLPVWLRLIGALGSAAFNFKIVR